MVSVGMCSIKLTFMKFLKAGDPAACSHVQYTETTKQTEKQLEQEQRVINYKQEVSFLVAV